MTNPYYEYGGAIPPTGTARSEDVIRELEAAEVGFDLLSVEFDRRVKIPSGAANEIIATVDQRKNKPIGFNSSGGIALLQAFGTWRGNWTALAVYANQDIVRDPVSPNSIFIANENHTAAAAFNAGEKTDHWTTVIDLTELQRAESVSFNFTVKTANFNCVTGDDYAVDCTSAVVATLPGSPVANDHCRFMHVAGTVSNFTIARNGKLIMGLTEDMTFSATGDANATNFAFALVFINDTYGWRIYPV